MKCGCRKSDCPIQARVDTEMEVLFITGKDGEESMMYLNDASGLAELIRDLKTVYINLLR